MKKKILFILPGFNFGGTVFSTLNMISFMKTEYDIFVLPMTYQGPVIKSYRDVGIELLPENIAISALMGKTEQEKSAVRKFAFVFHKALRQLLDLIGIDYEACVYRTTAKKIEKEYQFDFVASCQEGGATYFASYFDHSRKIAWFRSEYSVYRTEYPQKALIKDKKRYPLFDNIVCVSVTTRDDFRSFFPEIRDKIVAIHNIQNTDNIIAQSYCSVCDFPDSKFVIVSIGRMNPQKRFSCIPSIARKLLDAKCDFKWIIIGDGNAFGEWDILQEEIKKNEVEKTVVCVGPKINPYPYIRKAQLLVNTSYVEACPRVVIEAKILKTPIVCTDFSSAREFVSSDYDGYVDTIDNIYRHIINLINNRTLYDRIKKVCDEYVIDNERIFNQIIHLFS